MASTALKRCCRDGTDLENNLTLARGKNRKRKEPTRN